MPTLNWIGKSAVQHHHRAVPVRLLEPVPALSCGGAGSGNLIVQGDNLHALKALLPRYAGQVKCIYIDPPYNTGNEGWVYNDNVNSPEIRRWLGEVVGKEGETLDRHDRWLCMMYPRLVLLRQFLREDGVIFISIDDNELANLKLICDQIFGIKNYITSIPWQSRASMQNDTDLSINHEYIVCYAKKRRQVDRRLKASNAARWYDIKEFAFYPNDVDESRYSNPDNDPRGAWKADPMDAPNIRENLTYPIINPRTRERHFPPSGRHWRISQDKFERAFQEGRIIFGKSGKGRPQLKIFLSETSDYGSVPTSWFDAETNGTATGGTKELQKIFSEKVFDTPKPIQVIMNLLEISTRNDDIVLDSFAGSGTTAHAVLKQNAADGGSRRFILVEMDANIASTVTAERVRRAAQGYTNPKGEAVAGLGGGFQFCRLSKEPLFSADGQVREDVTFAQLAEFVWFKDTGTGYTGAADSPLLGVHEGRAIYLLYNGILQELKAGIGEGNILTAEVLAALPPSPAPR